MKQYLKEFLFFTALALSQTGWATPPSPLSLYSGQWVLTEQNGNVSIYTQDFQNSDFSAFKAEAVLNQPIASLFAVIADPTSCALWVDGCVSSQPAGGPGFSDRKGYAVNSLPWPFSDRDILVRIRTKGQRDLGIEITMSSTESDDFPENDDAVRITDSYALYYLEAISETRTLLIWVQHTEPAGALPAWIVNAKVIDLPARSIPKLEAVAGQARYQNARLIYDEKGELVNAIFNNGQTISSLYDVPADISLTRP